MQLNYCIKNYMKNKKVAILSLLFVLLILVIGLSLYLGAVKLDLNSNATKQILNLRIMRTILALVAGSGLALVGLILQSILRNPLVEPYVLGVSSGASIGAVFSILLGISFIFQPLMAFIFALVTVLIVYRLAITNKIINPTSLLLSGVIVGILFSSIAIFMVYVSPNEAIHGILWWLLGNLAIFDINLLIFVFFIVLVSIAFTMLFINELNAISLGEEEAMHLGIEVEKVKKILLIISSLVTASIVSVCGMIGFVGLIIPHIVRRLVGTNHKITLPLTVFTGGVFLLACDIVSRIALKPIEIPIGVITAIIGAPFFIVLLRKNQKIN